MATLESDEANIFDAESVNWRLIVYPILAVAVVVVGGLFYYYYQQSQRDALEASAREALVAAKTPEEMVKVADQFPTTDQAALALLSAADASFAKRDYDAAIKDYKSALFGPKIDEMLAESARLGLASSLEASGNIDDAIYAYLREATLKKDVGIDSPYAPYAYMAAARLYEEKGDKDNERKVLTEAVSLDPESLFVKQAQAKLKELTSAPITVPVPAASAPALK
jgi:predicted negative regulator of RcsB-dependent stress response